MTEGFIEPHFFAGFSGGRKSILPGICSQETVNENHSYKAISSPYANTGVLEHNPIHEDMLAAARIKQGKQDKLYLGNLSSLRDWGYAKDYVECMWLILQNDKPDDFVIATGVQHSVREFCQLAFHYVGIELEFVGEGMNEKGVDKATGKVLIEVSPDFYRPTDVVNLWGDPTKARQELGWNPTKTSFEELVKIMVEHDMEKVAVERAEENIRCNLEEYLEKGVVK